MPPTARKATTKKAAPKPPPVEVEETEDEELEDEETDELEELEEDDATDTAPAGKTKSKAQQVTFGVSDLAKYLVEKTGQKVDARGLRTLIRKMARDGSNRVDREIVAGNRARYDWSGVNDPEVKRIIAAFKGGELEADKQEKLAKLKADKAVRDAAKKKLAEKSNKTAGKTKKAAAPVVEDDDDEELEDED